MADYFRMARELHQTSPTGRLNDIWNELGEIEAEVLLSFAERLYVGQKSYGLLTLNKKNWLQEAFEESVDQSVYLCVDLLRRQREAQSAERSGGALECGYTFKKTSWMKSLAIRVCYVLKCLFR